MIEYPTVPVSGPEAMLGLSGENVQYRTIVSCVEIRKIPGLVGPPKSTCPGADWHAIVKKGLSTSISESVGNNPATRKMHVRGPTAVAQARKLPVPESAVVVTSITTPPRPPADAAPPP
jgi:hypothetical protein